jgi:hypothetical protein
MSGFLTIVARPGVFGLGVHLRVGVYRDADVAPGGVMVDKEVVVSRFDMHVGIEAFAFEKQAFCVGQVPANPHIGISLQGVREIAHCGMGCFKADELIEKTILLEIR